MRTRNSSWKSTVTIIDNDNSRSYWEFLLDNRPTALSMLSACKRKREKERERERKREKERERERKREKEREEREKREKERERERARARGAGPGRENRRNGERHAMCKGEEEGGRGEKKKRTPKQQPQNPENGEERTPGFSNKSIQKRTPRTNENTAIRKHGVRCTKPSGKTRRNKIEHREKPKTGRTFFFAVFGTQKGHFWAKKSPKKPRTPIPKLAAKNPPKKNLRQTELWMENHKVKRDSRQKNYPKERRTAFPLSIKNSYKYIEESQSSSGVLGPPALGIQYANPGAFYQSILAVHCQ